jgi:hypothetical protein
VLATVDEDAGAFCATFGEAIQGNPASAVVVAERATGREGQLGDA